MGTYKFRFTIAFFTLQTLLVAQLKVGRVPIVEAEQGYRKSGKANSLKLFSYPVLIHKFPA